MSVRTADRFVPVPGCVIEESPSPLLPTHAVTLPTADSAVLFFFPCLDAKGLSSPSEVESLREKVYATLEAYTKQKYPEQPGR